MINGIFIPGITERMFRDCPIEAIEKLRTKGEVIEIEYNPVTQWIPVAERPPESSHVWRTEYLATVFCTQWKKKTMTMCVEWENTTVRGKLTSRWIRNNRLLPEGWKVIAWKPMPEPYSGEEGEAQ